MENNAKSLNRLNNSALLYKERYIEDLKKEYAQVEEEYNNKLRAYRAVLFINFAKRKILKEQANSLKFKLGDIASRIKMIENL